MNQVLSTVRPGARLRLQGVSRGFGHVRAVDDVSIELAPGSFTALLGPSGCGKSTLLNVVAGLDPADSGTIDLDGQPVDRVPAERRPIGLVFQKPLLFPHLSVAANVAFGLRMAGVRARASRARAEYMLDRVGLAGLADRRVGQLSGGQEQRVALARALVLSPRLLLLDEPFSQLDAALRTQMRRLVRELTEETKVTAVFVTHDQAEAVDVADDIVLMLDGRIAGHGAPELFYRTPPTLTAARFFGVTNEIPGRVTAGRFALDGGGASLPTEAGPGPAVLVIRPESLILRHGEDRRPCTAPIRVVGTVVGARFAGPHLAVEVALESGVQLEAHVPVGTPVGLGATVTATARADQCTVLPVRLEAV